MMTRLVVMGVVAGLIVPMVAAAQDPDPTLRVGTRVGVPASGYQQVGQRDPFAPLVRPPSAATPTVGTERRAPGLAGQAIADVELRGIIASGATRIALLRAADGKTYMARAQDRLHDGIVRRIEADAIVLLTIATPHTPAREIRKPLRPAAGGGHP